MSWFFGRKKHLKDSPTDSTDDENNSPAQGEDFIFVERKGNPQPSDPGTRDGPGQSTNSLYPNINDLPPYPTNLPPHLPKQTSQVEFHSYLSGVPFKFSKQLETSRNDDMEIDSLRINEILSYILRLQDENFEYDFSVEKSIVKEMESSNE